MPNFAILSGTMEKAAVANLIVADSLEDAEETMRLSKIGDFCIQYGPGTNLECKDTNYFWINDRFAGPKDDDWEEVRANLQV